MSNQSTHQSLTTDAYLNQLDRQGYLDRERIGEAKGVAGKKRGRGAGSSKTQQTDDNQANIWEWKWGPRAMSEVGEVGIAQFVAEFMVQRRTEALQEDDENEGEGKLDDSSPKIQKLVEAMMKGVEKAAAGGKLLDIMGK